MPMPDLNPTLAARLVAEMREDDERLIAEPWIGTHGACVFADVMMLVADCKYSGADHPGGDSTAMPWSHDQCITNAAAIARTRNNLAATADQLEAALAEVERLTRERDAYRKAMAATGDNAWTSLLKDRDRLAAEVERSWSLIEAVRDWHSSGANGINDYKGERDDCPTCRLLDTFTDFSLSNNEVWGRAPDRGGGRMTAQACRRCSECVGQEHHWIENGRVCDPGDPYYVCKHCDAACAEVDDENGFATPSGILVAQPPICEGCDFYVKDCDCVLDDGVDEHMDERCPECGLCVEDCDCDPVADCCDEEVV